jgi:hypothetical protein
MHRRIRAVLGAAALGGLLLLPLPASPASAQEVQRSTLLSLCGTVEADASAGPDGRIGGFASSSGAGCPTDIWSLRGAAHQWETVRSPYRGTVLATSRDDTGTYVLYNADDGLRLGKHSATGAFEPTRRLSTAQAGYGGGDVASSGGQWWAVWSEHTGAFGQGQLYQAKTFGGEVARQRITNHPSQPDHEPSITLQPGAGGALLAWTRFDAPVEPNSSDIWMGTSGGGAWSFRPVFTAGRDNGQPDLHSDGPSFVGFVRDGAPAYADNTSGAFRTTTFPRPELGIASQPGVGAATGRSYLGWIATSGPGPADMVLLSTRRDGGWHPRQMDSVGRPSGYATLHAVIHSALHGGTVVYSVGGELRAASTNDCVYGAIRQRYESLGGPGGFLRNPVTCELGTPNRPGRFNHFQGPAGWGGSIYWSVPTGAWEVHGAIRQTWSRLGWENSAVGFPVTNEMRTPNKPGAFNHFERGSIYWSPATGAREVRGAIRQTWSRMGWENSLLGFPVTNELRTPNKPGAFNHFQGPAGWGGSIYWSPESGAHPVYGAIRAHWASLGWENGALGFPTSGERPDERGGRWQEFQSGYIHWTPEGGAVVDWGP